jgi:hypothetical protein
VGADSSLSCALRNRERNLGTLIDVCLLFI